MAVLIKNRQRKQKLDTRGIRKFTQDVMDFLGCGHKELSLVLTSDTRIRELNRDYLGKDKPTNVISFAMAEGEFGNIESVMLGDVIVSVDTAYRDAALSGIEPLDEIHYLLIHGILHLIGYDHETRKEGQKMRKKEAELFSALKNYKLSR